MGNETVAAQVGRAWRYQREGQADNAIKEYEKILQQQPDDIDANYGMGLAQRTAGHPQAAVGYFQHALDMIEKKDLTGKASRDVAASESPSERVKPNSAEEDRYMMLTRMLKQRLNEVGAAT